MNDDTSQQVLTFDDFKLSKAVLKGVQTVGYENPSPIQEQTIPHLLAGVDLIGQAQTGTGKTAAFALPILSNIDIKSTNPQVLVLTPTRELAIQVSEAFKKYAVAIRDMHVMPIYGGQSYEIQLRKLKRGVHVVVGTPGRVMDHIRKKTLILNDLKTLVLDEADEMLKMGFIDDVEWILEQTPNGRQIALFSATMPKEIRQIAQKHLKEPVEITIKAKTATVETTNQRFYLVHGSQKLDALTRILESEMTDGVIVFVRTRQDTVEVAERLEARGFAAAPINGDISQNLRERTIDQLKSSKLDILVATDVAARGLDVDRISHVINYDIPYDTESYVHRIGRTGRAGRSGEAILFVAPREKRMLSSIERATGQKIERMKLPSNEKVNEQRICRFRQKISDTIANEELEHYFEIVKSYSEEMDLNPMVVAGALAKMVQGEEPLLIEEKIDSPDWEFDKKSKNSQRPKGGKPRRLDTGMERYRIEVGHADDVKPGNIVGAIANEANLDSQYIGRIAIYDNYSTVDLPEGMPREILQLLKNTRVSGRKIRISKLKEGYKTVKPKGHGKRRPKRKKS